MAKLKINPQEVKAIFQEVEKEVLSLLKSQEAPEKEPEEVPQSEGKEEGGEMGGDEDASGSPEALEAAPAPKPPIPDEGSGAGVPQGEGHSEPDGDEGMTMEELHAGYAAMSMEDLEAHLMAIQAAITSAQAATAPQASMPGAVSAPATPAPPPMPQAISPAPAMAPEANDIEKRMMDMNKSLKDIESRVTSKLEEQLGTIVQGLESALLAPSRKAVSSLSELGKSEGGDFSLSRAEVVAKLNEKAKEGSLSKSDRSLIDRFCVGTVGVKEVKHLLS